MYILITKKFVLRFFRKVLFLAFFATKSLIFSFVVFMNSFLYIQNIFEAVKKKTAKTITTKCAVGLYCSVFFKIFKKRFRYQLLSCVSIRTAYIWTKRQKFWDFCSFSRSRCLYMDKTKNLKNVWMKILHRLFSLL